MTIEVKMRQLLSLKNLKRKKAFVHCAIPDIEIALHFETLIVSHEDWIQDLSFSEEEIDWESVRKRPCSTHAMYIVHSTLVLLGKLDYYIN